MNQALNIEAPGGALQADLVLPPAAKGLVIFCHGSGSNRHSPRNVKVAEVLQQAGLATLLPDLTPTVAGSNNNGLDQARRNLLAAVDWTTSEPRLARLPLGLFGASSGAAVALDVAASRPERVRTVVSRGGRPDLAFRSLGEVRCPTLLIVGSADLDVLELNAWAAGHLRACHDLLVIPGANHLFSEPGTLDSAAKASCLWFIQQFSRD